STDVASISYARREADVFLNNGSGRFGNAVSVSLTPGNSTDSTRRVISADLNKDGKSDLIGITDSSSLTVSLSNSSGSSVAFGSPITFAVGGIFLGLADVNSDGVPDLVRSTGNQFTLLVYPGDGFGSFGAPVTSAVNGFVSNSDFGDFNGDGKLDIAISASVPTSQGDRVGPAVLYGDGKGRFGSQVTVSQSFFGSTLKIAVRDLNSDAKPDIVIFSSGVVLASLGGNDGKPGPITELFRPLQLETVSEQLIGNFDATGKPGIANINFTIGTVQIYAHNCAADGLAIYGRVKERAIPRGIGGVTIKLSGAKAATVVTDNGGNYQFSGLQRGAYTVTPERPSTDILPFSASFNLTADVIMNFDGARRAMAISAASYQGETIAPNSIAALFGFEMTSRTAIANQQPLPQSLGGVTVTLQNNTVGARTAQLFFVSPNQINFLVPADLPPGISTVQIFSPGIHTEPFTTGLVQIERISPGLFAADASGRGLAAAVVLRVRANGSQVYEPVARFDTTQNKFVAVPIDVSNAAEQVFLVAFGTGISGRSSTSNFVTKIGGEAIETVFVGGQEGFVGLDQINWRLPRNLTGRGNVDVVLTVDGKIANTVQV
ncbi:MAG: FG-GAP-like repeat-containing protein, partial [Blastocatellia bacterium]